MDKKRPLWIWLALVLGLLAACRGQDATPDLQSRADVDLQVESTAFAESGDIPIRFTCDGDDASPPLSWSEPPPETQSLALIFDDPDAPGGTWNHWELFNIPATLRLLPEGVPADPLPNGLGIHGSNSWQRLGYGGPCPPPGSTHRYFFHVYALDTELDLEAGSTKEEIQQAMQGHILAQGSLMARYGR
jgi:Raf kinase inhibitor-like YbhB/YbcL family protein